ncbi:hypothetical protein ACFPK9_12745 [Rubritalea spongiae]
MFLYTDVKERCQSAMLFHILMLREKTELYAAVRIVIADFADA